MILFLTKLLALFSYPLGASLLAGAVVLIAIIRRFRVVAGGLLTIVLVSLWILSTPVFANWILENLESRYPEVANETLPAADAAILLGGVLSGPRSPILTPGLSDASDRIIKAWRLYRAGKVPRIVISGGNLPWLKRASPEAEVIADFLVELGVPRTALVVESESRNTHENAVDTAKLFKINGWRTALLVTSAAHMPRALATFKNAGLDVFPATTDIRARMPFYESLLDVLPDADALAKTTSAFKELVGLMLYQLWSWA